MSATDSERFLRVEKGAPDAEELAALTAVLLARAAGVSRDASAPGRRATAGWRRLERRARFAGPRTWQ
ncbi:acyl-CoA carboxylase epsilon subunit [Streptomyces sp. 21So2-11]|uniref:acyl-CoA carboxylase epsilon subunit n=1 Tax=Streptomyces sp. 21So2-11 TaxID=3144408 RepID=UPI003219103A